jgi:hypothetical protein
MSSQIIYNICAMFYDYKLVMSITKNIPDPRFLDKAVVYIYTSTNRTGKN